jgi:hypothetical protein
MLTLVKLIIYIYISVNSEKKGLKITVDQTL